MIITTERTCLYLLTIKNPNVNSGDVNGDDKTDAVDARWTLQMAAGMRAVGDITVADVDGNGTVDAVDARWILQAAANMRTL